MGLRWMRKCCDTLRHGFHGRRRTNAKGFICRKEAKGAEEGATKETEEGETVGESERAREEKTRRNSTINREKESEEITVIYESINKRGGEEERNESDEEEENTETFAEFLVGANSEANSYESAEWEKGQRMNSYESAEWEKGQRMNAGDFVEVPTKLLFILPLVALLF
ncbi:hypothetical protein niasHT_029119 [Heterodera trifolii]|uniref:Uncharacterized protein n=1 Tax=Heterodera trifolii TaxID=157864 RepID=A0ABD2KPK6_9BILA